MKAALHDRFGGPEVIHVDDIPDVLPRANEVRVRVHATTVNRTDCGFRKPEYLMVRPFTGFFRPKHPVLGSEFAGVVDSVGEAVTRFKVGDRVFGLKTFHFGAHAEYMTVPETGSIAAMPKNFSFDEAAAVCDGLMLAQNYVKCMDCKKPLQVLVNGATGSIGSAAVQLLRYHGAEVTATCKTSAIPLIQSLGAHHIIDYTREDFTKSTACYDAVFDMVGKSTFGKCRGILKPKGVYYSSELGPWGQNPPLAIITPVLGGRRVGFPIPTDNQKDIEYFRDLIEAGHYRAVIDRTYPLAGIAEASRYVETGEKVGNVVIQMVPPGGA